MHFELLLIAAVYGAAMKAADLFDEHKKHWFKGDALLFGLIYGIAGALLVVSGNSLANVVLAMVLACFVRMRIDYRNHTIAATMIILAFCYTSQFNAALFSTFFIIFTTFGGLRDYLGDVRKKKDWLYKINEPMLYYIIPTAIYGVITGNWIIFAVFTTYVIFYDGVKILSKGF